MPLPSLAQQQPTDKIILRIKREPRFTKHTPCATQKKLKKISPTFVEDMESVLYIFFYKDTVLSVPAINNFLE